MITTPNHDYSANTRANAYSPEAIAARQAEGIHLHTCLRCENIVGEGYDCETDTDHDFVLCDECAAFGLEGVWSECDYCHANTEPWPYVPDLDDDESWGQLAEEHRQGCEWVATRAHRVEAQA